MKTYAAHSSMPVYKGTKSKLLPPTLPMLTPTHAWRILCRRTGCRIARNTFYRWISAGRIGAVRVGYRFLVPLPLVEELIQRCLDGERI